MKQEVAQAICESFLTKMTLGEATSEVFRKFSAQGVTASSLAESLQKNPALEHLFSRYVHHKFGGHAVFAQAKAKARSMEKQMAEDSAPDSVPDSELKPENSVKAPPAFNKSEVEDREESDAGFSTRHLIAFLGMERTRYAAARLRLYRMYPEGKFDEIVEEKGKFEFAEKCEKFAQDKKIEHSDAAFCAGLFIDWLKITAEKANFTQATEEYLKEFWPHSIRVAFLSNALAQVVRNFGYQQFAFSAGFLMDIGGIFQALRFKKDWMTYYQAERPRSLHRIRAREFDELEQFEFTTVEFTNLLLYFFEPLTPITPAIRYFRNPDALKKKNENDYKLAGILLLAKLLVNSAQAPDPAQLQALKNEPWYRDLRISDDLLTTVTKKFLTQSF